MNPRPSQHRYAALHALVHDLLADVEKTCQVLRAELQRRGWTNAQIDGAIKEHVS